MRTRLLLIPVAALGAMLVPSMAAGTTVPPGDASFRIPADAGRRGRGERIIQEFGYALAPTSTTVAS